MIQSITSMSGNFLPNQNIFFMVLWFFQALFEFPEHVLYIYIFFNTNVFLSLKIVKKKKKKWNKEMPQKPNYQKTLRQKIGRAFIFSYRF